MNDWALISLSSWVFYGFPIAYITFIYVSNSKTFASSCCFYELQPMLKEFYSFRRESMRSSHSWFLSTRFFISTSYSESSSSSYSIWSSWTKFYSANSRHYIFIFSSWFLEEHILTSIWSNSDLSWVFSELTDCILDLISSSSFLSFLFSYWKLEYYRPSV